MIKREDLGHNHLAATPANSAGEPEKDVLVSVVLPCLNEERTIVTCVTKALNSIREHGVLGEVVVSDNGSTDRSVQLAKEAGARVVNCKSRGYGAAVRFGVENSRGTYIIMADGDDSYDLTQIGPFICQLQQGADMVMGNRFQGGIHADAMPWKNRYLGNPGLTFVLNFLYGTKVGDTHCGLRSFSRSAYDRICPVCPGMEFASELIVRAAILGLRIDEVPTTLQPDGRDRPPHLSPWRDGFRHLKLLLNMVPSRRYGQPGVIISGIGGMLATIALLSDLGLESAIGLIAAVLLLIGWPFVQLSLASYVHAARLQTPKRQGSIRKRLLVDADTKVWVTLGVLLVTVALCVFFGRGLIIPDGIAAEWPSAVVIFLLGLETLSLSWLFQRSQQAVRQATISVDLARHETRTGNAHVGQRSQ